MNATGERDHDSAVRGARRPVLSPIGVAARPPRGHLAMVAIGSLAVVVAVLGWRWAHRPRPPIAIVGPATPAAVPAAPPITLEVTVLEVKSLPPPPAPAPVAVAPAPPPTPPPPAAASRTLIRTKKPAHASAGRSEPSEARPAERVETAPPPAAKSEPQKPAIEANPYLYK